MQKGDGELGNMDKIERTEGDRTREKLFPFSPMPPFFRGPAVDREWMNPEDWLVVISSFLTCVTYG